MLNRETIDFFKNVINNFTDSVVMKYPVTVGNASDMSVIFKADLSKLDPEQFEGEIGIYRLNSFINIFNVFDDYNVQRETSSVKISDEETSVSYLTTNIAVLSQFNSFDPAQFDKLKSMPSVLDFVLTAIDIKKLRTASASLKELNTVVIEGSDTPSISLIQKESAQDQSSNSISIKIPSVADKNFKVYISIDTLLKLPIEDYEFKVKYNEAKDAYRLYAKPTSNDVLELILPLRVL